MFRAHVLIVRRVKLYYIVSGIITPVGGRPVHCVKSFEWFLEWWSIMSPIIDVNLSICLIEAVTVFCDRGKVHAGLYGEIWGK